MGSILLLVHLLSVFFLSFRESIRRTFLVEDLPAGGSYSFFIQYVLSSMVRLHSPNLTGIAVSPTPLLSIE